MYKERILSERLLKLVNSFPAVVISGARQVGKSTILSHLLPSFKSITFDPVIDIGAAREDPSLFLMNNPAPLILDEIQYAPELGAIIKRKIDENRAPGQYVITGSQQWSVMKTLAESLAGRAVFLDMYGFSIREIEESKVADHWLSRWLRNPELFIKDPSIKKLNSKRTVNEQLWRGSLPEADQLTLEVIPDFYSGYLRTYIERDVRLIADVADWQQFGRFVKLTAALTAQEVNHSKLGRDISTTPQTAQRWLSILTATYQWKSIPVYSGNTLKRLSGKPKGYILDTGLICALNMISSPLAISGHPLAGPLFETAVVSELFKLSGTMSVPPAFYHWRSHGGAEVDIILERDGILFPIEIKLSSQPKRGDTRGITAFRKTYPNLKIAPGLVIAPTDSFAQISENDYSIPWDCQ